MQDFRSFMKSRKKFGDSEDFKKMRDEQRKAREKAGFDGDYESTRTDSNEGSNGGTNEAMSDNRRTQQTTRAMSQEPDLANTSSLEGNKAQANQMQGGMRGLTPMIDGDGPTYEAVDATPESRVAAPTPDEVAEARFMDLLRSMYERDRASRANLLSKWEGGEADMDRVINSLLDKSKIYEPAPGFYRHL